MTTPGRSILLPLLLLLALLAASGSAAAQQQIPIEPATQGQIGNLWADPRPLPDWDYFDVLVAGTDASILVRNDDAGDPGRAADVMNTVRALYADVVVDEYGRQQTTDGLVGAYITAGTLRAVEFDLFDEAYDPDYDTTPEPVLGVDALIGWAELVYDDGSGPQHVGRMYCYDPALYALRKSVLAATPRTTWLGSLVHTSSTADKSVQVLGSDNVFEGAVASSGGLWIGGYDHVFDEDVLSADAARLSATGTSFASPVRLAPAAPLRPAPESLAWYGSQPQSLVFGCDLILTDDGGGGLVVDDGTQQWKVEGRIVRTSGSVYVAGEGLSGTVTLVADGEIVFSGSSGTLSPAATDLLAWSLDASGHGVSIDGSANALTGSLLAPAGVVSIPGSDNRIEGQVTAGAFKVSGSGNTLSDGSR